MPYIPPELFCKIPLCLHKKIERYLSHPVADLVKALFKDWKNPKRDDMCTKPKIIHYVRAARQRAHELKHYKNIKKKHLRQMKLDIKFGTNNSKICREQLCEKRFENIVTKTMLDVKNEYEPYIRANPWAHRECPRGPVDLPYHPHFRRYGVGYATKKMLFEFVRGLNPKAKKSWRKEKLLQSIYPNLGFLRFL
tara:strand:+ start:201 stop:782 length:582 start_codon:yes stop_codon:yes gene_type:complete